MLRLVARLGEADPHALGDGRRRCRREARGRRAREGMVRLHGRALVGLGGGGEVGLELGEVHAGLENLLGKLVVAAALLAPEDEPLVHRAHLARQHHHHARVVPVEGDAKLRELRHLLVLLGVGGRDALLLVRAQRGELVARRDACRSRRGTRR